MGGFLRALLLIAVAFPGQAFAFECGDLDASGTIGATDALRVLRRAVGLPALGGHLKSGQSWTPENRPVGGRDGARVVYSLTTVMSCAWP